MGARVVREGSLHFVRSLPEKPLVYFEGKLNTLSPETAIALANLPFDGKEQPDNNHIKTATLMWGPPSSGKTFMAQRVLSDMACAHENIFKRTIVISYDEHIGPGQTGALYNIPAYMNVEDSHRHVLLDAASSVGDIQGARAAIRSAYELVRADSQYVRSLTFDGAIRHGFDLFVDMTSQSLGTIKMIENLRKHGYKKIVLLGCIAGMELAEKRHANRIRPVDHEEVYAKRVGTLQTLPQLLEAVDTAYLYHSVADGKEEALFLYADRADNHFIANNHSYERVRSQILTDKKYLLNHTNPLALKHADTYGMAADKLILSLNLAISLNQLDRVRAASGSKTNNNALRRPARSNNAQPSLDKFFQWFHSDPH